MKANRYYGKHDVRVEEAPEPKIEDSRDAVVKVEMATICGSDLHIYNGYIQPTREAYTLGHERVGEVVEVGGRVTTVRVGDRVVVPFPISCGECFFCRRELYSTCETTNPNRKLQEEAWGHFTGGIYGYSEMLGGDDGAQAEYLRVPHADVDTMIIPDGLTDQ